jgi:hypothetical protein
MEFINGINNGIPLLMELALIEMEKTVGEGVW